jgi:hypothetical protein
MFTSDDTPVQESRAGRISVQKLLNVDVIVIFQKDRILTAPLLYLPRTRSSMQLGVLLRLRYDPGNKVASQKVQWCTQDVEGTLLKAWSVTQPIALKGFHSAEMCGRSIEELKSVYNFILLSLRFR